MNPVFKEAVVSLQYVKFAYDSIFEAIKKEVEGVMADPHVIPISFSVNFISFKEGDRIISVGLINGSLSSRLEQIKRNGYANMNYSFKIQTEEAMAKGLLRVKIVDRAFIKKDKKQLKHFILQY